MEATEAIKYVSIILYSKMGVRENAGKVVGKFIVTTITLNILITNIGGPHKNKHRLYRQ